MAAEHSETYPCNIQRTKRKNNEFIRFFLYIFFNIQKFAKNMDCGLNPLSMNGSKIRNKMYTPVYTGSN